VEKLVTTGRDKKAHVRDVDRAEELQSFEVKSDDGMNFIWLSGDGKRAHFVRRHLLWNYDLEQGKLITGHNFSGGRGETWFRNMSRDGKVVVSSGIAHTVRVFDLVRGSQVNFEAPQHSYAAALSADGRFVLDAGGDSNLRLRSVSNLKQILGEYKGAEAHIYVVDFSADGKLVLAGGAAKKVYVWEQRSGKLLHKYEIGGHVKDLKTSANGLYAAIFADDVGVCLLGLPK